MKFERKLQFLTGLIVGDGCITKMKARPNSLQLSFKQSERQKEYLTHKRDILTPLYCKADIKTQDTILKGKTFTAFRFRISKANDEVLQFLRCELYENSLNRKIAKECTWERFNAESLAYLYMDNGSLGYVPSSSKTSKVLSANLVMALCYPLKDTEIAKEILNNKFGLNFKIYRESTKTESYSLRLRTADFEKFKKIVHPYFVDCMNYKLRSSSFHERGTSSNQLDGDIVRPCRKLQEMGIKSPVRCETSQ